MILVTNPPDSAAFPTDIAPPTITWHDASARANRWVISVSFVDGSASIDTVAVDQRWTPPEQTWTVIKERSPAKTAHVEIHGISARGPLRVVSEASCSFSTSPDSVRAPIFYREVNLPFIEAVKGPSRIRWRFGTVSSPRQPPVVLDKLLVYGSCHSFSNSGAVLGMDVDYANDKGSYFTDEVRPDMVMTKEKIMTWSDFRRADGKYIVFARSPAYSLNKHRSTNAALLNPEECSEFLKDHRLFRYDLYRVPLNGARGGEATPLEGASHNDMSNFFAKYSPDGKWIVYCRARSYMLLQEDSELFIIPSNGGVARRMRCNRAAILDRQGALPDAMAELRAALKKDPDYTQARLLLSSYLLKDGKADEAITECQAALVRHPAESAVHVQLGLCFLRKKMPGKAAEHLEIALRNDPHSADARQLLEVASQMRRGTDAPFEGAADR